jgi:hypothetical protein
MMTGLQPLLRRLGAEPNDWLLLLVDGECMEVHACLGAEEEVQRLLRDVKATDEL